MDEAAPQNSFFDAVMYAINNGFDIPTIFTIMGFCLFMFILICIAVFIYWKLGRDLNEYKKVRAAIDVGSAPIPPDPVLDGRHGQDAYDLYVADLYINIPVGSTVINGTAPPLVTDGAIGNYYIDTTPTPDIKYGPKTALGGWGVGIVNIISPDTIVLNGTVPPGSSDGLNGDYYIDTNLNLLHGPKTNSGWNVGVSITPPTPLLSTTAWVAKFSGTDGLDGADAAPAIDGSIGEAGSVGDIGVKGKNGVKGNTGVNGDKGIEGDSFITFIGITGGTGTPVFPPVLPALPLIDSPSGFPSCEFIDNTPTKSTINYFYQKKRLFDLEVTTPTPLPTNMADGYVSFIIYDDKYRIIGFTSPLDIHGIDLSPIITPPLNLDIKLTYINPDFSNKLFFRGILSLNKGLTLSSFTDNVIEKSLKDSSFTFTRPNETDAFVKKFYDIIEANPGLKVNDEVFKEKIVISQTSLSIPATPVPVQLFATPFNIAM